MTILDSDIKAIMSVSYVGQSSYKFVYPKTPAKIGEFQIKNISFIDGQGSAVSSTATSGTTGLTRAVAAGQTYLYPQLLPNTGSASLNEENPATPGSPVTLSNTTWDYDTSAPDMEITCFLPSVMITTANGPKAVEDLTVGELVLTGLPGEQKPESITWIGRGHVEVDPSPPNRTWEKDAGAPLGVEMAFVLPLYQSLEKRARL